MNEPLWKWETKSSPVVMKGTGALSCDEFDDEFDGEVRGQLHLLSNGWVTLTDRFGKVRSFSPSIALEIAWDGPLNEGDSDA